MVLLHNNTPRESERRRWKSAEAEIARNSLTRQRGGMVVRAAENEWESTKNKMSMKFSRVYRIIFQAMIFMSSTWALCAMP